MLGTFQGKTTFQSCWSGCRAKCSYECQQCSSASFKNILTGVSCDNGCWMIPMCTVSAFCGRNFFRNEYVVVTIWIRSYASTKKTLDVSFVVLPVFSKLIHDHFFKYWGVMNRVAAIMQLIVQLRRVLKCIIIL